MHKRILCCVTRDPCSYLLVAETQQSCSSTPPSLLKLPFLAAIWICNASFTSSSLCLLARSKTWVSCHLIGWSCLQACSAVEDFSNCPQLQASLCSSSWIPVVGWSSLCMSIHMRKGHDIPLWTVSSKGPLSWWARSEWFWLSWRPP